MTLFNARLAAKDDTRILCGGPDCRDQLAGVVPFIGGGRQLGLVPGWIILEEHDGYRRLRLTPAGRGYRRYANRSKRTDRTDDGIVPMLDYSRKHPGPQLPAYAECGAGHLNILEGDRLNITYTVRAL